MPIRGPLRIKRLPIRWWSAFKSEVKATVEEYLQKLQQTGGEVNKMVADVDGEYKKAKIEADAYYEQQTMIAKAIENEGGPGQGIEKMVEALNSSGGKTMIKLKLAEALSGKKDLSSAFWRFREIDLKTTNVNDLLKVYGVKALEQR